MKWDRINRKWLLPFEYSDYSPFDLFLGLLPLPHFSKVSKVSKIGLFFLFVDITVNFVGLIMAKKWLAPFQDCQPVIGLGYLEKNYGKGCYRNY